MRSKALVVAAGLAVSAAAVSASAGVFAGYDYEGSSSGWSYTYGNGNNTTSSRDLVPASGSDGSQAVRLTADFTNVIVESWGTWSGGGIGQYIDVSAQPMSVTLTDYTVKADAKAVGTYNAGGHQRVWLGVEFFAFDDKNPDGTPMATPDANTDSQLISGFSSPRFTLAEGTWQTPTYTFDQLIGNDIDGSGPGTARYTWDDALLAFAAGNLHGVNIVVAYEDGANADRTAPGRFGLDAGNQLWGDNFQVSVVPEPSSLGFLVVGALLARRRK